MAFTECANGHLYDADQYATCPYCNGGGTRIEFGAGASDIGRTAPAAGYGPAGGYAPTSAVSPAPAPGPVYGGGEVGSTVAPESYRQKKEKEEDSDAGKTVGVFKKSMNLEPVVGWLVCIEGAEKGKDFRIYARNNTIGRSEKMDICLKGDTTISRENHARLAYDEKHNNFHLIPAESTNNIYLNEEPIYIPAQLHAYDEIELGDSKFVFLPLCSDRFSWRDGLKRGE